MTIQKLVAGVKGDPNNSRGVDVAHAVNAIIDRLEETGESTGGNAYYGNIKFVQLKSIGDTFEKAMEFNADFPDQVKDIAAENQMMLEQAIGTRDADGYRVDDHLLKVFNVEMPEGYFPILGDLDLPPTTGRFVGQGAFKRRKYVGFNGEAVLESIEEYPTCLMPIGGSDKSGILTRCSSTEIGRFTIHGGLKEEGDGGHGVIEGHTPPIPELAAATDLKASAASMSNPYTQNRFGEPEVHSDIMTFRKLANGDSEIDLPVLGTYSDHTDIIKNDDSDIPLVRWVRAFNADGVEIKRWANIGWTVKPDGTNDKIVGINDTNRMCTARPKMAEDGTVSPEETRVYHRPFTDQDPFTQVVVPGGLPDDTVKVEVSLYNLVRHKTYEMLMFPYLSGAYSQSARATGNYFHNIFVHGMPWNGWMMVDGTFNTHDSITARYCGLDGFHAPSGYEDYMHSTFRACTAVNNQGWGLYFRETEDVSRSSRDSNKWPNAQGEFETHRKWTYWAAQVDFTNFDTYGNRGGAYYFGTGGVNFNAGAMEYHFDQHNVDPFGTSSRKHLSDWNPLRWTALVVFGPLSDQNTITVSGSPTDARRNLFCVWRNPNETPAPTNADSNIYRAIDRNYYTHPRTDSYGSLVEVSTPSISHIAFTQYGEQQDDAGDNANMEGSGLLELHGSWSNKDTFLYRPHLYTISPKENFENDRMHVVYSVNDPDIDNPCKNGAVTLSADEIGIAGQNNINMLYKGETIVQMQNRTIAPGKKYTKNAIPLLPAGVDVETLDLNNVTVNATYVYDQAIFDANGTYPEMHSDLVMMPARLKKWKNAAGDWKLYVVLDFINMGDADIVHADVDTKHNIVYTITGFELNRVL